jgi:hypothetical protein
MWIVAQSRSGHARLRRSHSGPTQQVASLTGEELYEQVWATPMSRLAAHFGLSDVGLANACDRHNVPRPPRGHWANLQFGTPSPRSLPPCDPKPPEKLALRGRSAG